MEKNKEIKVYGTLKNWTIDSQKKGKDPISGIHYDAIAYADQLYDNWFGESTPVNNFQDVINRRITAIKYTNGTTTIQNRDGINPLSTDPYVLKVIGPTNIEGGFYLDGTFYVKKNGQWIPIDIAQLKLDVDQLKNQISQINNQINQLRNEMQQIGQEASSREELWKKEGTSLVPVDSSRSVKAFGFYDTDPQMI